MNKHRKNWHVRFCPCSCMIMAKSWAFWHFLLGIVTPNKKYQNTQDFALSSTDCLPSNTVRTNSICLHQCLDDVLYCIKFVTAENLLYWSPTNLAHTCPSNVTHTFVTKSTKSAPHPLLTRSSNNPSTRLLYLQLCMKLYGNSKHFMLRDPCKWWRHVQEYDLLSRSAACTS